MNVAIDLGNTYAKVGWFDGDTLIDCQKNITFANLPTVLQSIPYEQIVFSSVSYKEEEFMALVQPQCPVLFLNKNTPLPVGVNYDTPNTLGVDRLAAAIGAWSFYPDEDVMVIDSGSCITYDLVSKDAVYQGGAIAPGLRMRFKAMHEFTKRLPEITDFSENGVIGKSTISAMQSGVINGMTAEIEGMISRFGNETGKIRVVMCGGDAPFFEKRLKLPIFVVPELVLIGLNRILQYNVPEIRK